MKRYVICWQEVHNGKNCAQGLEYAIQKIFYPPKVALIAPNFNNTVFHDFVGRNFMTCTLYTSNFCQEKQHSKSLRFEISPRIL